MTGTALAAGRFQEIHLLNNTAPPLRATPSPEAGILSLDDLESAIRRLDAR